MANVDPAARLQGWAYAAPIVAMKTGLAKKTSFATKPSDKPDDRSSEQPPGPRRGAIPTPREIIEKAKPFVPGGLPPVPPKAPKPESK
jgi:hypothetical protein